MARWAKNLFVDFLFILYHYNKTSVKEKNDERNLPD